MVMPFPVIGRETRRSASYLPAKMAAHAPMPCQTARCEGSCFPPYRLCDPCILMDVSKRHRCSSAGCDSYSLYPYPLCGTCVLADVSRRYRNQLAGSISTKRSREREEETASEDDKPKLKVSLAPTRGAPDSMCNKFQLIKQK